MEYVLFFFSSRHILSYDRGKLYYCRDECVTTNASSLVTGCKTDNLGRKEKREMKPPSPRLNDGFALKPKCAIFFVDWGRGCFYVSFRSLYVMRRRKLERGFQIPRNLKDSLVRMLCSVFMQHKTSESTYKV